MKLRTFETSLWLPLPPEEVFPFFADAGNLQAITPDWLHFRIETPAPIQMRAGALIDYRLRVRGIPLRWRTRINVWEPPCRFEDEQLRGPYRRWVHEHRFEAKDGGTLASDHVTYAAPLDFLLHESWVRPDIERIFAHRRQVLSERFAAQA
jgi:ligand-binding SRPBCC domain-containing protein